MPYRATKLHIMTKITNFMQDKNKCEDMLPRQSPWREAPSIPSSNNIDKIINSYLKKKIIKLLAN